ncbi:hypothetical protein QWJ34_07580 [Saccharibacillus sp. CPCC 101409]|nr:hypothetical protein [Saccharibacillus sp. CPCC 101409]MDO3409620.1 hypothetical protein [Saccharibacillus sp. CPCC 101409]
MHDYFQSIEDKLDYGRWFFGHYHAEAKLPRRRRLIYQDLIESERSE